MYSSDITIDGVYTIFVQLTQNKNILNQDSVDFTIQVTMLPACNVTFPLENTAVIDVEFVINVDDEIVIELESE